MKGGGFEGVCIYLGYIYGECDMSMDGGIGSVCRSTRVVVGDHQVVRPSSKCNAQPNTLNSLCSDRLPMPMNLQT